MPRSGSNVNNNARNRICERSFTVAGSNQLHYAGFAGRQQQERRGPILPRGGRKYQRRCCLSMAHHACKGETRRIGFPLEVRLLMACALLGEPADLYL